MREPLSRIVWLTETKIRRRFFLFFALPCDGFRACQHGQKTNAVVVFRLFQASFVWRAPPWRWASAAVAAAGRRAVANPEPTFPSEGGRKGGRERMREIWGCMVRKATFEYHRKGAERSFISALSCHLRASREHSTVTDGTLNFRSGGRIRKMLRREIFSAKKGGRLFYYFVDV